MNERILLVERELNRISKVVKLEYYNPIMVLNLMNIFDKKEIQNDQEEQIKQIKKNYKIIVRLIHPDKAWNIGRFCEAFNVVNIAYKILLEDDKRNICINALQNEELLEQIYKNEPDNKEQEMNKNNNNNKSNNKKEINSQSLVIWEPRAIVLKQYNNIQNEKINVTVNIAIDGAEHTKNKCKSKSDKHQKGLKQRVVQKKNAEHRIINHDYSFTSKVIKEEKKSILF
jgi:hypothetical protein